jgi:hypothetical protein
MYTCPCHLCRVLSEVAKVPRGTYATSDSTRCCGICSSQSGRKVAGTLRISPSDNSKIATRQDSVLLARIIAKRGHIARFDASHRSTAPATATDEIGCDRPIHCMYVRGLPHDHQLRGVVVKCET